MVLDYLQLRQYERVSHELFHEALLLLFPLSQMLLIPSLVVPILEAVQLWLFQSEKLQLG